MSLNSFEETFGSEELSDDLAQLGELLVRLPPDDRVQAASIYSRVLEANRKRRQLLSLVRDSITDMRLDLKYLEFDLEATRRERDRFRDLLEADGSFEEHFGAEFEDEVDDL